MKRVVIDRGNVTLTVRWENGTKDLAIPERLANVLRSGAKYLSGDDKADVFIGGTFISKKTVED